MRRDLEEEFLETILRKCEEQGTRRKKRCQSTDTKGLPVIPNYTIVLAAKKESSHLGLLGSTNLCMKTYLEMIVTHQEGNRLQYMFEECSRLKLIRWNSTTRAPTVLKSFD